LHCACRSRDLHENPRRERTRGRPVRLLLQAKTVEFTCWRILITYLQWSMWVTPKRVQYVHYRTKHR
jgi:hypothetical protein